MDFIFYYFNEMPHIDIIKKRIKQIAILGDKLGASLNEIDKILSDEILNLSLSMFALNKMKVKSFTVLNNSKLRKMRINKEADGFSDSDNFFLNEFFKDNIEAFSQLIAHSYILKSSKGQHTDGLLFYADIYSRYSGKKHDVYFTNKSGDFYIFENEITNIKLSDYITDYFGRISNNDIEDLLKLAQNKESNFKDMQIELLKIFNNYSKETQHRYNFINGAIMFLDFLAWKGLWQSQDGSKALEDVSKLIDDFVNTLTQYSAKLFIKAKGIPLSKLISISDTIAIFTPKVSDVSENDLLELLARLAKYILEESIKAKYPIRGAISYGDYSIINNIMIGPGIDECASWHEKGDWIGVHLTPTAQFICNENKSKYKSNYIISSQKIPFKSGTPSVDYCIKWSIEECVFHASSRKTKALLPEIAGKYINTYKSLENTCWKEDDNNGKK